MGKRKKRGKVPVDGSSSAPAPTGVGVLGALLMKKGLSAPETPEPAPSPTASEATCPAVFRWSEVPRVALRMERKGRGGKTVTVIGGIAPGHSDEACKVMKKRLGVGVRREGEEIVAQGDQRDRLRTWLSDEGVRVVG